MRASDRTRTNPNLTSVRPPQKQAPVHSRLELSSAGLGELEDDATASQAAVDFRVGVEPVVDAATLLLVQDDLESLGAVLLGAETLADNLDGVDEVGQDGVVHGSEGARAGALLLEGVARAAGALGAGEDAARGEDQDMAVRELLLQLAGEAGAGSATSPSTISASPTGVLTAAGHGGSPAARGRGQR